MRLRLLLFVALLGAVAVGAARFLLAPDPGRAVEVAPVGVQRAPEPARELAVPDSPPQRSEVADDERRVLESLRAFLEGSRPVPTGVTAVRARLSGIAIDQRGDPVGERELWLARLVDGRPAEPGATAYLTESAVPNRRPLRTDARGRFEVASLDVGFWWIGPAPAGRGADLEREVASYAMAVEVPAGVEQVEVVLRAERGLAVNGRVVGPAGDAPAGVCSVRARPEDGSRTLWTTTDSAGSFRLGPLLAGRYWLDASEAFGDTEILTVQPGDEVELHLPPSGGIAGELRVAASGERAVGRIGFWCERTGSFLASETSLDGGFSFQGLPEGSYDLFAHDAAGRFGIARGIAVAAGADARDVRIALVPGARLRVVYGDPSAPKPAGAPRALCRVFAAGVLVERHELGAGGRPSPVPVPASSLRVELSHLSASGATDPALTESFATRFVTPSPGEELEVRFELE